MEVQNTLQGFNLQWNQLPALQFVEENMAGVRKSLMVHTITYLEDLQLMGALFIYCIIH